MFWTVWTSNLMKGALNCNCNQIRYITINCFGQIHINDVMARRKNWFCQNISDLKFFEHCLTCISSLKNIFIMHGTILYRVKFLTQTDLSTFFYPMTEPFGFLNSNDSIQYHLKQSKIIRTLGTERYTEVSK